MLRGVGGTGRLKRKMFAKEKRYCQKIIMVQWKEVGSDNDIDCYLTNAYQRLLSEQKKKKNPLFLS